MTFTVGYTTTPGAAGSFALSIGSTFFGGGPYTMPQAGTIKTVSYYANAATGGNNFLGIYNDGGATKPTSLIATSAASTLASGWNTFNMTTNPKVLSGKLVWFCILPVTVSPTFLNDAGQPANTCWYDNASTDTVLPDPFAGANTFTNATGGLYGTFDPFVWIANPNDMMSGKIWQARSLPLTDGLVKVIKAPVVAVQTWISNPDSIMPDRKW